MVVDAGSDVYSPFPHSMNADDGPQSSEEGSGLHSPTTFGAPFSPHGDSFRYQHDQLDVERTAGLLTYDYASSLNVQQPPLLDTTLELPSPSTQHVTFPSQFAVALPHRNHLRQDFPVQHLSSSRLPHPVHTGGPSEFRYNSPSERRLPSGLSHEHSYSRQAGVHSGIPMDGDRRPPPIPSSERKDSSSNSLSASGSRESRKEISTVVIACRQCRGRKIRCDSTRPICNNCVRRSNVCEYDLVPKRRGPDKRPGTRQRSCKKRPPDGSAPPPSKRKRTTADRSSDTCEPVSSTSKVKENMAGRRQSLSSTRHTDRVHDTHSQIQPDRDPTPPTELRMSTEALSPVIHGHSPTSRRRIPYTYDQEAYVKSTFTRQLDENISPSPETPQQKVSVSISPTITQDQKIWWSNFLTTYPLNEIEREFTYLFRDTGYWLCFINLDFFLKSLFDVEARLLIQPALIYAGLAMATLMKSSEVEYKAPGRERALWLRNNAQSALDMSLRNEWIDASLAEAALIIALFETSAHPLYNPDRVETSLVLLDDIIRRIGLTTIDANDRDVVNFPAGCVPVVDLDTSYDDLPDRKCTCIPTDSAQPPNPFSYWSYIPPWDPAWTAVQIREEECRRICWSALSLMCNYLSQCVAFNRDPPNFYLTDSSNYALLFPGEVLDRVSPSFRAANSPSTKEAVWALYCRSMLLWCCTNQLRTSTSTSNDKVEFIYEAWAEAQSLQGSIRMHSCNLDTALLYMSREYVHNTQITITQTLRRSVHFSSDLQGFGSGPPIFKRKHAEEWLWYQDRVIQVVKSAISHLDGVEGYSLTRRPFQATWFANQLSICLVLWNYDRTLKNALILAKSILLPVEVMNTLWPCPILQHQADDLRQRLVDACNTMGIEPPIPANYTLPSL